MQQTEKAKFVLLGDKGVGKRTLLSYGFGKPGRLSPFYIPIEFVDVQLKTFQKIWNIQCYDSLINSATAPKNEAPIVEGFIAQVISGADAIFFCYAADDSSSFRNLSRWYKDVSIHLTSNTLLYLVETKGDLQNRINEQDYYEFTNSVKFETQFKVCGLKPQPTIDMFTNVVDKIAKVREFNSSQIMGRGSAKTSDYSSPEKRKTNGSIQDIRFSDKKEKIILMEGSYVKRFNVVEKTQTEMKSSVRMQPKKLDDHETVNEF